MITHRHAEANNKHMGEKFDRERTSSYLHYVDANNLYGLAMSLRLPYADFRWIESPEVLTQAEVMELTDCCLEVDVDYPAHLHDEHNALPLLYEHATITEVDSPEQAGD